MTDFSSMAMEHPAVVLDSSDLVARYGTESFIDRAENRRTHSAKRRKKYTPNACHDCKRRKVKCTGEEVCQQCLDRNVRCRYSPLSQPIHDRQSGTRKNAPVQSNSSCDNSVSSDANATSSSTSNATLSSTVLAPAPSDSRIDELCDRVGSIQRMLSLLTRSVKGTEDSDIGVPFQMSPQLTVACDDNDDTDQFSIRNVAHKDLSLSSQVADMSALLAKAPQPKAESAGQKDKVEHLIELPEPSSLQNLLNVYFGDVETTFPFLDRQHTESRIYGVVRRLGYSSYNRMLIVTAEDLSTVALLCMMLAIAECVDQGEGMRDGEGRPGRKMYLQAREVMQPYLQFQEPDLDVARALCLKVIYSLHCEMLKAASEAMFVTWRVATTIRLNNQNAWPKEDSIETLSRQKLWWTIYFLDRQVARRSGFAYHIRDTEFDVKEFNGNERAAQHVSMHRSQRISHQDITTSYLQALINVAKLWSSTWDTLFAVGAAKRGDWMEIEIVDARILDARRQLPETLTWNSDALVDYTVNGEAEHRIRQRLICFTRLELLRMLIRQNPVRKMEFNPQTAYLCARLARGVIEAHDLFILQYPRARASGYFTTCSAVECVYHLAPVIRFSRDTIERNACISAFNLAHSILVRLSAYNNVAKRALKALDGLVREWGKSSTTSEDGHVLLNTSTSVDSQTVTNASAQVHDDQEANSVFGFNGMNLDLNDWMNASMGFFYSPDFEFQTNGQV